jgi:hypothetical protein
MMSFRPNFTGVHRDGDTLIVSGTSDEVEDIVDIRVVVSQGARIEHAVVDSIIGDWTARMPAGGFAAGPAVVFGIETHSGNATTITWSQPLDVP